MKKAILGKKLGMLQIFDETGRVVPVTVVQAGPCIVTQKKTKENDGYEAIQIGFIPAKDKQITKPLKGHFVKQGVGAMRHLREFRLEDTSSFETGNEIKADIFAEGEMVDVSGISKGHGFTGVIQRWNQHTGPMAHGSKYHRGVGSMGANSDPSRVFKNKHMPGQYGVEKVTIQNLSVVRVDADRDLLLIRGAVPGPNGGLLLVRSAIKA